MRWDSLTGLEPETDEDRKKIRRELLTIMSGVGRASVVFLLLFTVLASLTDELMADLTREITFGPYTWEFLLLDVAALPAYGWALAPIIFGMCGLWDLKRNAHTGPRRPELEVDQDG